MTQDELIVILRQELKDLVSYLDDPTDLNNAIDSAERETWTLPQSSSFKIQWLLNRSKRYVYVYMLSSTSIKYKFEQYNRQHQFDHFLSLVKWMDDEFEKVQSERPDEFSSTNAYEMFGHRITAGFQYDDFGYDTTYDTENLTIVSPSD